MASPIYELIAYAGGEQWRIEPSYHTDSFVAVCTSKRGIARVTIPRDVMYQWFQRNVDLIKLIEDQMIPKYHRYWYELCLG